MSRRRRLRAARKRRMPWLLDPLHDLMVDRLRDAELLAEPWEG